MNIKPNNIKAWVLGFGMIIFPGAGTVSASILTDQANKDYLNRFQSANPLNEAFAIPDNLTAEQEEALKFLYAYMATPDITDYPVDFYLENIDLSLKARREMPWGNSVPDREWRHFVLPVRVNNENLDNSRKIFYEELKERVKGLSMEEAILEVNHWCHEKVSYQPSDARTSSPLATVQNALGRCGEESTFTVAALRSVGIPARQVYTPRWAHTDDNHAWVEAWADGEWHFLGACEPEAVLDLAWFNAPAARGMLMTTKVTGNYDGPEEQLEKTPITTVINVTENYAPTVMSEVKVVDADGNPVENAEVSFRLYNYAEFFPLVTKSTDKEGKATFKSGIGDLIVWVKDKDKFNFSKLRAGERVNLTPDKDTEYVGAIDFDIVPPPPGGKLPEVAPDANELNNRRKQYEDSVRSAYVNTFLNPDKATAVSRELGYGEEAAESLVKSRGNHSVITEFLRSVPDTLHAEAITLLKVINEKDLHDVSPEVLRDNLYYRSGNPESELYAAYVLNPRIEYEMLRPYKQELSSRISPEQKGEYRENPMLIVRELENIINIDSLYNPGGFRQSVVSSLKYGVADSFNRNLAFVALCRSIGIPARIDPVSGATQYADTSDQWHDVKFDASKNKPVAEEKGRLIFNNQSSNSGSEPKYYSRFTISALKNGKPQLMEFGDFEPLSSLNNRNESFNEGQYLIVSGQRLADGSVLSRAEIVKVNADEVSEVPLIVRQDTTALQVIGNLDAELMFIPLVREGMRLVAGSEKSILSEVGRGYYCLGIIAPGHEPSAHALNDISAAASELAGCGRSILLLFRDAESASRFRPEEYGELPENVVFGIDGGGIISGLQSGLEMDAPGINDMPLIVVADSFNRIVYLRKGYSIHLGETLAKILSSLSN